MNIESPFQFTTDGNSLIVQAITSCQSAGLLVPAHTKLQREGLVSYSRIIERLDWTGLDLIQLSTT